jgi:hypothetical protein
MGIAGEVTRGQISGLGHCELALAQLLLHKGLAWRCVRGLSGLAGACLTTAPCLMLLLDVR